MIDETSSISMNTRAWAAAPSVTWAALLREHLRHRLTISNGSAGRAPLAACRDSSLKERLRYEFLMRLFGTCLHLSELRTNTAPPTEGSSDRTLSFFLIGGLSTQPPEDVLTHRGRYTWVSLMREFFTAVNNFRDYCRAAAPMIYRRRENRFILSKRTS